MPLEVSRSTAWTFFQRTLRRPTKNGHLLSRFNSKLSHFGNNWHLVSSSNDHSENGTNHTPLTLSLSHSTKCFPIKRTEELPGFLPGFCVRSGASFGIRVSLDKSKEGRNGGSFGGSWKAKKHIAMHWGSISIMPIKKFCKVQTWAA